ncbi:MAG: helix-turn-helix domain-containing protein [Dorea sp.]|nr:helix-turn-helix domain-containing protein [Dorea sp.]
MDIEQMKYYKKLYGYSLAQISEYSKVPLGTVQKIFNGETKAPRYETLRALEKVLRPHKTDMICEALIEYGKKEGDYTLDDYYRLPEERRVELIDGTFYDMAAPSLPHQMVVIEVASLLRNYIRKKGGKCSVFSAPVDVQLDKDNRTMVQPDVFVVCDRSKLSERCVVGAPDFVIEVLSPSTGQKDGFLKLQKYQDAGVKEYWMIDTQKEKVVAYCFEEEIFPALYGFDSEIPVRLFGGELKIDFSPLREVLRDIGGRQQTVP